MRNEENQMDNDQMRRLIDVKKSKIPEMERRYKEASKNRLLRILEKKCKTIFIGALAEIEQTFGRELWGHGKDDSEKTQEELINYEKWQQARTRILNNGNNQVRAMENELDQYEVKWLRHQITIDSDGNINANLVNKVLEGKGKK